VWLYEILKKGWLKSPSSVEEKCVTYTTEKMFLEVELSSTWSLCFDDFENLTESVSYYSSLSLC
jgi:hypothetical protein